MGNQKFDIIIIGSGMGALTTAAVLSKFKKRKVLIIEKHFKYGGFTHTFSRKQKYTWDVGVHYVGDLQEGGFFRTIFDLLSEKKMTWSKIPDPYDIFVYPDRKFPVSSDPAKFSDDLIGQFPSEVEAIKNYFHDLKIISSWFARHITLKGKPAWLNKIQTPPASERLSKPMLTTAEYMDQNFKDPSLKGLLVSQWGNYGLPPKLSLFAIHATVVNHYLHGGYYPNGSASQIAKSLLPLIERNGGEIILNHEVTEVIIENNKATGVIVSDLRKKMIKKLFANIIISDIGAYNTYVHLLKNSIQAEANQQSVKKLYQKAPLTTNVTVYLGLKDDPRKLGFTGGNHWIYSDYDHDAIFRKRGTWLDSEEVHGAYLSFPSLKDSEHKGSHTAEIIAFCGYNEFMKYKKLPWKKRGEEYMKLKEGISTRLINFINRFYPGFENLIEYIEVSTPLTNEFFSSHPLGTIYGIPCIPERFNDQEAAFTSPKTPVENFYLTGVDVSSPGIAGAVMGGLAAVTAIEPELTLLKIARSE